MALVNVMEELVNLKLEDSLSSYDCCKCDQCIEDIKCIALNHLPPKYVSSQKGELFSRINNTFVKQNNLDIDIAICNAVKFVSDHPHHKK